MTTLFDRSWFQRELHRGNPGDTDFYARVLGNSKTCLEVGAGLGRVTRILAPLVERYVALDVDPSLLEWTAEDDRLAVRSVAADMRQYDLPERFDRILFPYNVLFCAGGFEGARSALDCAKRHLAPEGEIWLDVYRLEEFHDALTSGELPRDDGTSDLVLRLATDAGEVRVFERTLADPDRQSLEVRYEARIGRRVVGRETQSHDYLLEDQILALARECGLDVLGSFGDFDGGGPDAESELLVIGLVSQ